MRLRDAKELLKESRRLTRKANGLSDEVVKELLDAQLALEEAIQKKAEFEGPANELDELTGLRLGHLRKSKGREYFESIGVAVLFALILRAFGLEAFQLPTGSMEPTLLVGDHLFVAKYSYGVRVPFTTNYLFQWRDIERGDIVVFLFPVEEVSTQHTIGDVPGRLESYAARHGGYPPTLDDAGVPASARNDGWNRPFSYALVEGSYHFNSNGADGEAGTPDDLNNGNSAFINGVGSCLDERSLIQSKDYIKRVIGLAGDRIALRDNVVYVNGEPIERADVRTLDARVHGRAVEAATERMPDGPEYTTWSLGASPGQVPVRNVKGQSMFIFFSRDRASSAGGETSWPASIRWSRFFDPVR